MLALIGFSLVSLPHVRAADDAGDADDDDEIKTEDAEPKGGKRAEAGDETEPDEEEELFLGPHPDVAVYAVFPEAVNKRFQLGQPITITCGFHNKGSGMFNITGIGASLHAPHDFSHFIQNYTGRRVVGAPIGPNQQGAADYQFQPDDSLEPLPYGVTAWVAYNDSNDRVYMHYFYNGTVELYDAPLTADPKAALSWLGTLALVGGVGYLLVRVSGIQKRSKKRKQQPLEQGTRVTAASSDLNIYTPAKESKPVSKRRTPSKGRA